ncbi:MAG: ABC transporter permease [Deltaproteobacteria bacterium]|nr:ABC transporter permease [Deltaproteobacteria bacterium]
MTLKDIAFKNLRRRKAKAGFILAGILIGVATMVTLISLIQAMTHDINHKLEKYGANILIVPKTESLSLTYGGLSVGGVSFEMQEIQEKDLARIKTIKNAANVAAVGPMVLGVIEVAGHRVLLAGIDFQASKILKPWWKVQGSSPGDNGILLGTDAARVLNLKTGSPLKVNNRDLAVSGILESTGSQDDQLVFTKLDTAQAIFGKQGRISMAEVAALCNACPIDDMVQQISGALPGAKVMAIQQVVKSRMETLQHFLKFSYAVSIIVLLVGGLMVLVSMMGSVRERTGEIGIWRAIGFRRSHVIRIVLLEAGTISALAGIFGYLIGLGATKIAVKFLSQGDVLVPFDPQLAAGAFTLAVLIGIVSSIYPAMLAARLDPNEALRSI